jgi:hypothetical protein
MPPSVGEENLPGFNDLLGLRKSPGFFGKLRGFGFSTNRRFRVSNCKREYVSWPPFRICNPDTGILTPSSLNNLA